MPTNNEREKVVPMDWNHWIIKENPSVDAFIGMAEISDQCVGL
jgi:hypothetical protein